jgi:hypothetical protein
MDAAGFSNSWTEGEISDEFWDRVDIQPITKGCALAQNLICNAAGPLDKRRGFWRVGPTYSQAHQSRLIAFRKTLTDALMLEFSESLVQVWQANGVGPPIVTFASPYTAAQAQLLRFKQVQDVIYLRMSDGSIAPKTLTRNSDVSWTFAAETYPNGPWLSENATLANTVTLTNTAGPADIHDSNATTSAGAIPAGASVTVNAANPMFNAGQVGQQLKIRANASSVSAYAWSPGVDYAAGNFATSVGNMYQSLSTAGNKQGSNPPVQDQGTQSDGDNVWQFVHDGAGVITITGYTSSTQVTGTVTRTVPVKSGVATSFWSFGAYSPASGWPTAWPTLREERLVNGATLTNEDFLDLTQTAGFAPTSEDYTPGSGLGTIVDTNAIRRRLGDDGGQILWFQIATYLVAGTITGEYLVAGSVLDEPLSPAGVTLKQLSNFGSADVYPAKLWNGLCFVARGGKTLRWLSIDTQQGAQGDDFSFLAQHLATRGFTRLAWVPTPDEVLWAQLADGGLAAMAFHKEQAVRGWTTQALPMGFVVEDLQVLPGPGGFETLWLVVSRPKGGATQRLIWMQSQVSDTLFLDGAELYAGAPTKNFAGFTDYANETISVIADGVEVDDVAVDNTGAFTLGTAAAVVQAGQPVAVEFDSLKLSLGFVGNSLNTRQRIVAAIVSLKCALAQLGLLDGGPMETVSTRLPTDTPGFAPKKAVREVTLAGDGDQGGRDPRIRITETSGYDFRIYSIKPKVAPGG